MRSHALAVQIFRDSHGVTEPKVRKHLEVLNPVYALTRASRAFNSEMGNFSCTELTPKDRNK